MNLRELNISADIRFELMDVWRVITFIVAAVILPVVIYYSPISTFDLWDIPGILAMSFVIAFLDEFSFEIEEIYKE